MELSNDEIRRYSRHLILPEVGMAGQKKLKAAFIAVADWYCFKQEKYTALFNKLNKEGERLHQKTGSGI